MRRWDITVQISHRFIQTFSLPFSFFYYRLQRKELLIAVVPLTQYKETNMHTIVFFIPSSLYTILALGVKLKQLFLFN